MTTMPSIMRYHGGKWRMADWIISHFPPDTEYDAYIEPFGGGASVLMRKTRSPYEVYNDLDGEVVNVFQVLRNPGQREQLESLLRLTPFAREEFERSYQSHCDPVEQARRTLYRSFAGFGSAAATKHHTGFRGFSGCEGKGVNPAAFWSRYPQHLARFGERLSGVVIECRDALDVIQQRDRTRALFYLDPPYIHSTRALGSAGAAYRHELTSSQHEELLKLCKKLEGFVVLSGYATDLYRDQLVGWQEVRLDVTASARSGSALRTESLWLNPRALEMASQLTLNLGEVRHG